MRAAWGFLNAPYEIGGYNTPEVMEGPFQAVGRVGSAVCEFGGV
jgi:hypothetical protein